MKTKRIRNMKPICSVTKMRKRATRFSLRIAGRRLAHWKIYLASVPCRPLPPFAITDTLDSRVPVT